MKSKIEINISVIDDGPVVMRCQGQNTSKGKALDALEDAYLSTVAQLMRKDLSKAEQEGSRQGIWRDDAGPAAGHGARKR